MPRNKSHGLKENDVLTYNNYLDSANAESSPDTAPTLIPELSGDNVTMRSLYALLKSLKEPTIQNESLDTNITNESLSVAVSNESLDTNVTNTDFPNQYITKAHETVTNGLKSINSDHALIHKGLGYCGHLYLASLGNQAVQRWRIKGPTTKYAHIKNIQVGCEGTTIRIRLIKDATITNAGTEVAGAIANLNHNSENGATIKFYDSGVTYTGGSIWCEIVVHGDTSGVGANLGSSGGEFIQSDYLEYVTKTGDEDYVLEITNLKTDTGLNIQVQLFFYEEEQGIV
jgi:hypothetical protein